MSRSRNCLALVSTFLVVLSLRGVASSGAAVSPGASQPAPAPAKAGEKATTESLGGPDRFLTFISSDKPIYKIGEKVYIRGVMLNAANHKPIGDGQGVNANIQITGPKGDVVGNGMAYAQNSVWGFAWQVPEGQAGGEYKIKATYPWQGYAPAERKFDIRAYRAPRLNSQITFLRDGYGPGEKVTATLDVKRAEGGVPEGAKVTVTARVDGTSIDGGVGKVDAKGLCTVSFDLPRQIPRGEGTLALVIEDGGVVETASKTIPILLQTVDLQMFPEGGDLIAGYKNRVYVQAFQPNGKPADLEGKLVTDLNGNKNSVVANFKTEHEGRGRFEFVPEANRKYSLTIVKPAGIKTVYNLPEVKSKGAVIRSDRDIYKKDQPVTVSVGCTSKSCRVTLSKREVELTSINLHSGHGVRNDVSLAVPAGVDGVLTVTVWDEKKVPLAERLVFCEAAKPLTISLKADKQSYVPGDNAKVTVKTTDAEGKPVSAMVGVTVTDESVLQMIEKREQAPRLPVMVFLESEVKDLADAQVYLDRSNPKAPLATDLLLGTQGWRRFAFVDANKFTLANGDQAKRVLAQMEPRQYQLATKGVAFGGGAGMAPRAVHGNLLANARMGQQDALIAGAPDNANAVAFAAQREAQIVADRPVVRDFRGAPKAPVNLPEEAEKKDFGAVRAEGQQKAGSDLVQAQAAPQGQPFARFAGQADMENGARFQFAPNQFVADEKRMAKKQFAGAAAMMVPRRGFVQGGPGNLVVIREFAHQVRPDRKPSDRADFAETLYWNAAVKTDPTSGEGTINFGLNDGVTTFQIFADAFSEAGAVGAAGLGLKSVQPFYAEAKLPLEVTAGDKILLPISLINATANSLTGLNLNVNLAGPFKLLSILNPRTQVGAGERVRCIQPIEVGFGKGIQDLILNAKAGQYEDKVDRHLSIKPKGFPIEQGFGGILEPGKSVLLKIKIEKNVIPESVTSNASVYPSPLANMTGALERMIQDPNGCFEQTSSTSYPLTMAQQYFLSHTGVDPKLVEQSREKLDAGYKRLISFWCPDKGYEWFGENPGHEALTAFGLLHFNDMSQVRDVDQNMVATTRAWLLKQKDGNGGFTRKRRSLHTWIEDKDCSNAYIVWALLQTGQSAAELKPELASLKTAADASKNNYVVALAANAFELAGDKGESKKLMERLAAKQQADGSVADVTSSIVGSGGESLEVEGTSLATMAWLREPAYAGNVEKSIKYLADSCKDGRYGSTQATVLALRAIVTYDKQRARPTAAGKVRIYADGKPIGDAIAFDKSTEEAIKFPDISELLSPGDHNVELRMEGGSAMPYSLAVKYNTTMPANDGDCKVDLTAKLAQDKVMEGASTEANVTVHNRTKEPIPTPIAIIGLPGGLEPRHDQLKELVKKGTIDAYEVLGREVVLYWRALPAEAKVQVPLSLIAAVPGSYTGPASRAYLYYTDEHKDWVDGMHVDITAKN